MNTISRLPASILALLLLACSPFSFSSQSGSPEGTGPSGEEPDPPIETAYLTHVVCYGNALEDLPQGILAAYDVIILEARCFSELEPRFHEKALLYFNMWGKSCYLDELRPWAEWQPAPGELGEPEVVLSDEVYCYRFDDAHVQDFLHWIEDYLQEHGSEVKGVFLDDFAHERNWWDGEPADKDLVWGPWDGRPGWREDPSGWNVQRVEAIEEGASDLVAQYCGQDGMLVVNGTARRLPHIRRFAENVGHPGSEAWDRLEIPGVDEARYARPGDFLQVNGIGESGLWGDWTITSAGHGYENLVRAATLARQRACSVGLAYGETPRGGGSRYSLLLDPGDPDGTWPDYFAEPEEESSGLGF